MVAFMEEQDKKNKGKLEVVCGPMFSGKSEELMRRLRRAKIARQNVIIFKPKIDTRYIAGNIVSHDGNKLDAFPIEELSDILEMATYNKATVIGIDEAQFFTQSIINIICTLIEQGKRVVVAGLDLDYRGVPFGPMPTLLAIADTITKLQAICNICGIDAHFTQRIVDSKPAPFDDKLIIKIGGQESYQARCRSCHVIDKQPFTPTTTP